MKSLIIGAVTALTLAACAGGTGGSDLGGLLGGGTSSSNSTGGAATAIGKSLIQNYAHNQCSVELNKRQEWRLVALAVTAEKQQQWEDQICGCVSEEAPNSVTVTDLVQAATNQSARTGIVANAVTKTVTSCLNRFVKN
ncbi:MAG: hypothetical protein KA221_10625 [Vitreoscilla sp.]|jgi:hypothetical protein|nr:hypothetical protein [Vitreoscilla sp.]MBP9541467.1 hypothetical protein [Vitreoscilla sp.]